MADDVTMWLGRLLDGDEAAAQPLWDRYFAPMLRLARRKLGQHPARAADEEDVALSAFQSFCRAAIGGRFSKLDDRDDLWRLLVTLTARKAVAEMRRYHAQKRGGGLVQGESVLLSSEGGEADSMHRADGLAGIAGPEATPDWDAMMREQCARLIAALDDPTLQQTALLKLEGHTNGEIAGILGCALATIERKFARIRKIWKPLPEAD